MPTDQAVKIGLFGGPNGDSCDITDQTPWPPASLKSVDIWSTSGHDGFINAIGFTFRDGKDHRLTVGPWGTPLPDKKPKTIDMEGAYLTKLTGYTDGECITSLTFFTTDAKRNHGPFGRLVPKEKDIPFSVPLLDSVIVAFFGQANDPNLKRLNAIGVYVVPLHGQS